MKPQTSRHIFPKTISLFSLALLAGCASAPPTPQTVYVPVATLCVRAEEIPARPKFVVEQLSANATAGEKILALARDWPAGRKYEDELRAAFAGCEKEGEASRR